MFIGQRISENRARKNENEGGNSEPNHKKSCSTPLQSPNTLPDLISSVSLRECDSCQPQNNSINSPQLINLHWKILHSVFTDTLLSLDN